VAEDSEFQRELIRDGLLQHGLVERVLVASQGDEFITSMTRQLLVSDPPDLCILDLEMPVLGGYHAAVSLRSVEQAFQSSPVPILFFTARPCDEVFRKALAQVGHASYLNKSSQAGPAEFFGRLEQVLRTFQGKPALTE
jgi:CheY-like chemotaxis protein